MEKRRKGHQGTEMRLEKGDSQSDKKVRRQRIRIGEGKEGRKEYEGEGKRGE